MKLNNKISLNDTYNLGVDFDLNGNGFISWTDPYSSDPHYEINRDKGELIIKKLSGFKLTGDEISLGTDYGPGNFLKLDQNGNGVSFWLTTFPKQDLYFREIKKYIPENPVIIDNSRFLKFSSAITVNKFGDGFITWQSVDYNDPNASAKYYGRLISNFTISREGVTPVTPVPRPTPIPMPSMVPPPFIFTPDGKPVEIATAHGIVADNKGNPVSGATVKIKSISYSSIEIPEQITIENGTYLIRNVPVGEIEITVSKNGYRTVTRTVTHQSNMAGNPEKNTFDFTGEFALVQG